MSKNTFVVKSIVMISIMIMLFSCKNDLKVINSFSQLDSLPAEMAYDIELIYSDSGKIQAYLESPLMRKNEVGDSYIEFPDGFKVIFYDSLKNPESEITALYGIMYEVDKKMEAKHNVVVKNITKNEKLETEHLIWDRQKESIYTDVFIKITKPDQVLFGEGMVSDQSFESYEIKNPTGEISVYPDDI